MTRTVNVMCGKTEIESMKHQLAALGVLRPKIAAIRREFTDTLQSTESNSSATVISAAVTMEGVVEGVEGEGVVAVTEVEVEVENADVTVEVKDEAKMEE